MNYLFDIPIGTYDITLTGTNDQNFQLRFTPIDTIVNQNNGGNPIRSLDINFEIP